MKFRAVIAVRGVLKYGDELILRVVLYSAGMSAQYEDCFSNGFVLERPLLSFKAYFHDRSGPSVYMQ